MPANHVKHSLSQTRGYDTWHSMVARCYNPWNPDYRLYGAKGIGVCNEWKDGPGHFIAWLYANHWTPGLVVERIDRTQGYSPENCRLASRRENARYHADNKLDWPKVHAIREQRRAGRTNREIAESYGLCISTVYKVTTGRMWAS